MEEAEALSDQIAIMGDGKLKTIGTSLHLKNKLGAGYSLTASTKSLPAAEKILENLAAQAPGARMEKVSGTENGRPDAVIAEYSLPRHMADADMSTVVKTLELKKGELDIARFSVNHATLDSVFKRVAALSKEKDEDEEVKKGCWNLLLSRCLGPCRFLVSFFPRARSNL
jgi:ABC-type multidrug transport system ATPase subunit